MSRFIHGMDKRSIVSNFEAKVYDDVQRDPLIIKAIIKEKQQAKQEFEEAVRSNREAVYAESDNFGNNFAISLGAINRDHKVVVEFTYLVAMDLRKSVDKNNPNDFMGQGEQSFYELLIPVCFKPKYTTAPTGDRIFATGAEASEVKNTTGTIRVEVVSSTELEVYDQTAETGGSLRLEPEETDNNEFRYQFFPTPMEMGDVFLKIMNHSNFSNDQSGSVTSSSGQESAPFESDNTEVRLFKFSDILKVENPLYDKYGLVVDYAIRRKTMHTISTDNFPKRHHHFVIDCSG